MTHITNSNLVSFLYELARDHVPVGAIEKIVRNSESPPKEGQWALCTEGLGQIAEDWNRRLRDIGLDLPKDESEDYYVVLHKQQTGVEVHACPTELDAIRVGVGIVLDGIGKFDKQFDQQAVAYILSLVEDNKFRKAISTYCKAMDDKRHGQETIEIHVGKATEALTPSQLIDRAAVIISETTAKEKSG